LLNQVSSVMVVSGEEVGDAEQRSPPVPDIGIERSVLVHRTSYHLHARCM